jgi:hypothetical protein
VALDIVQKHALSPAEEMAARGRSTPAQARPERLVGLLEGPYAQQPSHSPSRGGGHPEDASGAAAPGTGPEAWPRNDAPPRVDRAVES